MRWIIVLAGLAATSCAAALEPRSDESIAVYQTASTAWQDQQGHQLPAAAVEEAYRACQVSMFKPNRAAWAAVVPLEDENARLALTDPQLDVCMSSFGYSRVASSKATAN